MEQQSTHNKRGSRYVYSLLFENSYISNLKISITLQIIMSTWRTKSMAKIEKHLITQAIKHLHFSETAQIMLDSEILSAIFNLFFPKIGNYVIIIIVFDPFLALAKNLTIASRPNERKGMKKRRMENLDCLIPHNDAKQQTIKRINKQSTNN